MRSITLIRSFSQLNTDGFKKVNAWKPPLAFNFHDALYVCRAGMYEREIAVMERSFHKIFLNVASCNDVPRSTLFCQQRYSTPLEASEYIFYAN